MAYRSLIWILTVVILMGVRGPLYAEDRGIPPQKDKTSEETTTPKEQPGPNLDGVVEVSFKIDNLGKVQILNINSTSPQLSDYVIKKLSKIQLEEGNTQIGKIIKYRFVFKKQA